MFFRREFGTVVIALAATLTMVLGANAQEQAKGSLNLPNVRVLSGDALGVNGEIVHIKGVQTPPPIDAVMRNDGACEAEYLLGHAALRFAEGAIAGAILQIDRESAASGGESSATVYVNESNLADLIIEQGYGISDEGGAIDWCARNR